MISSSLRHDGFSPAITSCTDGIEHVYANDGEVAFRLPRLLDDARHAPFCQLGDAERLGVRHGVQQDLGAAPVRRELLDVGLNPAHHEVVAEVQHEPRFAQEVTGRGHGVGDTERRVLLDVGDVCAEPGTIPDCSRHLLARLTDDDADVLDAGLHELLDRIEDHRLVGDRARAAWRSYR